MPGHQRDTDLVQYLGGLIALVALLFASFALVATAIYVFFPNVKLWDMHDSVNRHIAIAAAVAAVLVCIVYVVRRVQAHVDQPRGYVAYR